MDLEMTGLEPARHVIVEIATIVTDDDLNVIAEGPDLVVHQPEAALAEMPPVVVEMHTRSGLLEQIHASTLTLEDAGAQTLAFLRGRVFCQGDDVDVTSQADLRRIVESQGRPEDLF